MAHLKNERGVQKDLEHLSRWSAVGNRPERVRNASCHLRGQEKRFGCCRLKWNSFYDLKGQELRSSLFKTVEAGTRCSNCITCWTTVSVSLKTSDTRR
jgi:hypothetical protein